MRTAIIHAENTENIERVFSLVFVSSHASFALLLALLYIIHTTNDLFSIKVYKLRIKKEKKERKKGR